MATGRRARRRCWRSTPSKAMRISYGSDQGRPLVGRDSEKWHEGRKHHRSCASRLGGAAMALIVFLRGVNVGGRKRFKPSLFANALTRFKVVSHGAAGTFIVHGKIGSKALRDEILHRLPFEAEVMICTAEELIDLVHSKPFGDKPPAKDVKWFVSILRNPPRALPRLPIDCPMNDDWEVRVVRVTRRFALSLWRRRGRGIVYPNEVVENALGVSATTRGWNTVSSVCNALQRE